MFFHSKSFSLLQFFRLLGLDHDRPGKNGEDMDSLLSALVKKHEGEIGIGWDHWAIMIISGDSYTVTSTGIVYTGTGEWKENSKMGQYWHKHTDQLPGSVCVLRTYDPNKMQYEFEAVQGGNFNGH